MSLDSLLMEVEELVETEISKMERVRPEVLGLDPRCASYLYVSDEAVAVTKGADRMLQYYGGFEYIDKDLRTELGSYVFYSVEAGRVQRCIDKYEAHKDEEDGNEEAESSE